MLLTPAIPAWLQGGEI